MEITLHWAGVACYIAAAVALTWSVVFAKARGRIIGSGSPPPWLVPHAVAIGLRWVAIGHGPYMLRYEVLSSNAWVAVAVLVLVLSRRPAWTAVAVVAMPLAILAMAFGMFSNPETRELPPTLRSIWLTFHIIFAKVSAAAFLISLGSAVLLLVRRRTPPPAWTVRVPAEAALDALIVRSAGFGFIFWTVTIAAGAIWGNQSWGRYWGWDPIETWSLVSWITWGSFLHARLFLKLGPRATAWLAICAFTLFIVTLLILPMVITSLHSAYFS